MAFIDSTRTTPPAENGATDRSTGVQAPQDRGAPRPRLQPTSERRRDASSRLAEGYRQGEPYIAASSTLVASVVAFTALGYWLDRKMGHSVQWLLLVGAVVGMLVGFVSFFTKVLRPTTKR